MSTFDDSFDRAIGAVRKLSQKKPSAEQLEVLRRLRGSAVLCYYKGGFWSTPNPSLIGGQFQGGWSTGTQTVRAMETRGWLKRAATGTNYDVARFPDLADRTMTEDGLTVLRRFG